MDCHNLAVCFGPTLCPIPAGRDLVLHTTLVNDLIKNFIIFCPDIFNFEIDGPVYRFVTPAIFILPIISCSGRGNLEM